MVTWSDLLHVLLSFLSYSIKLLAVQELLDKEALEKVNILFFLPHQQNPDPQPEAALTAEGACFFVLPTVSLADLQSKPPAMLVHTYRPKLALFPPDSASKQQKQERDLPRASLQACCPPLSAPCLII